MTRFLSLLVYGILVWMAMTEGQNIPYRAAYHQYMMKRQWDLSNYFHHKCVASYSKYQEAVETYG